MKAPRTVAIIQARMRSTRLPGKVLQDLGGKPAIQHVVERAQRIRGVSEVVVAVPKGADDAPLRQAVARLPKVTVFAGDEKDVLDRYYQAAKAAKAEVVLRITADCPLLDPEVARSVLDALLEEKADYASNTTLPTFPDGLDVEAVRFSALKAAWKEARSAADREHVTPFVKNDPKRFKQAAVIGDRDRSDLRWTLDEPADLEFLRAVFARLHQNGRPAGMRDVLAVLEKEPSLARINGHIRPNEGYYRTLLAEKPLKAKKLRLAKSLKHLPEALRLIPGGSQTFSKAPNQFVKGAVPLFTARGKGARVWDLDGNEYLDTTMALAPVVLGYADDEIDAAVAEQLPKGIAFSQPHPLEVEVARTLTELIPCAEMVRFGKNGSDVTAAAVRLARAHTGRDIILAGGYHGWQDWYIGTTTRSRGVPEAVRKLTIPFKYNDIEGVERLFKEHPGRIAGVILEAIGVEEPRDNFLQKLAEVTRKNGAVLIFDEVITGFRFAPGGAQQYFGVTPDLACVGKAMANGYPVSAIVGRGELMRLFEEIFFSFTFGGELASLAACRATLAKLKREPVVAHIWHQGRRLIDGYNTMARELGIDRHTKCSGLAPHSVVTFKKDGEDWWDLKSLVQQECARRGLLFVGPHYPCWALTGADVDRVLRIYASVLRVAAEAIHEGRVAQRLDGPAVQPVFRKP